MYTKDVRSWAKRNGTDKLRMALACSRSFKLLDGKTWDIRRGIETLLMEGMRGYRRESLSQLYELAADEFCNSDELEDSAKLSTLMVE